VADTREKDELSGGEELRALVINLVKSGQLFTDLHIEQDEIIRWFVPGGWIDVKDKAVATKEMIRGFLNSIKSDWEEAISATGAFAKTLNLTDCRLRINVFFTQERNKISITIRKHPLVPKPISESVLSPTARKLIDFSAKGLFIVTGPTGSGKTTTLASIVDFFNREALLNQKPRQLHIITIEDPIEYIHERKNAILSPKSVPHDVPSFAQGLKDALQQKPNIILIGEVRDAETADTMFHAAESGHLVFATLHTNSAVSALNKLLSFFPESEWNMRRTMMMNTLLGVVSQVMVPDIENTEFLVASEQFLNNDRKIQEAIQSGKFSDIQAKMKSEKETLSDNLIKLVRANKISGEVAVKASYNPIETLSDLKVR